MVGLYRVILVIFIVIAGCSTAEPVDDRVDETDSTEQVNESDVPHLAEFDEEFDSLTSDAPPLGEGDNEQTRRRLAHLQQRDQFWRNRIQQLDELPLHGEQRDELTAEIRERVEQVDREHTEELRNYLNDHPWPCREEIGPAADSAAFLVVQHADHAPDFQREVLAQLEQLVSEDRTDPENFALLYDRVAVNNDTPQRFGSQGSCTEDGWQMDDVEDPDGLDERRQELGLMPIETYREMVGRMCEQMSN